MKKILTLWVFLLLLPGPSASAQEDLYAARRHSLMGSIDGGIAVLSSDADQGRFDKNFYYLTGIKEPGAVLVLAPGAEIEEALFSESGGWGYASGNPSAQWMRPPQLTRHLGTLARERPTAYVSFRNVTAFETMGRTLSFMSTLKNVDNTIAEMRVIKDEVEIEFLRRACQITAEGLNEAFQAAEVGTTTEQDLAEVLESAFHDRGSPGSSFLQAASGPNAVNVHFGATERVLEDGDIIVFDVGAWWHDYTADISRTIPANGRFSKEQGEIYTVVLNSQKAAIELMTPGTSVAAVRERAQEVLIDGLHELGLVLDKEDPFQRQFFIAHGYYHFIGLDIHDVWSEFGRMPGEKVYEPGMIMTMEPGLYFPADLLDAVLARLGAGEENAARREFLEAIRPVYEKYVDIGVRIEDDVLITAEGNEILTSAVPKEIDAIEAMMKG